MNKCTPYSEDTKKKSLDLLQCLLLLDVGKLPLSGTTGEPILHTVLHPGKFTKIASKYPTANTALTG